MLVVAVFSIPIPWSKYASSLVHASPNEECSVIFQWAINEPAVSPLSSKVNEYWAVPSSASRSISAKVNCVPLSVPASDSNSQESIAPNQNIQI